MKWTSHVLISASICVLWRPEVAPMAILGATAPDWLEGLAQRLKIPLTHRGVTHVLTTWIGLALLCSLMGAPPAMVAFVLGGVIHWLCDALTVSGAPVGWWSSHRTTLFGGKIVTGDRNETRLTLCILVLCLLLLQVRGAWWDEEAYSPFFTNWEALYHRGVIDPIERRVHRFLFF